MKYLNNDEYDGKFENILRKGNGIMKYIKGEIYDGKWNDYKKVKNNLLLIQNNIFELFNFGDSIYIGFL